MFARAFLRFISVLEMLFSKKVGGQKNWDIQFFGIVEKILMINPKKKWYRKWKGSPNPKGDGSDVKGKAVYC